MDERILVNAKLTLTRRITILTILYCFLTNGNTANTTQSYAEVVKLQASWYSLQSLKDEGTYKHSKGVCADGSIFNDNLMVCACRLYPLGSILRVTNLDSGRSVIVRVADRIGRRFTKTRIDLSKSAFIALANLKQGIVRCKVERIGWNDGRIH